ncbi:LuxR C-terminal-related transcriptional regulator [Oleisolibacter albus]|uniref:LuxR C-terminal-related transcriptional regulator n=1 Tax=Oleisolibacter albus TaxID=2171757 RepID=UPI000DF23943|nr:response regulator transcription factor [Oleisolibacter albus]
MNSTPVVVADSNRLFRQGLATLLAEHGFTVVAGAATASELKGQGSEARVVLFDVRDGVAAAVAALREACPQARIIMLSEGTEPRRLAEALQAGVDGCLLKDSDPAILAEFLRLALMGEKVFPSAIATLLMSGGASTAPTQAAGHKGLSQREMQILRCLVRGDSNKMIANQLGITEATVKVHLKSLLRKINASNRTQAAIWAMNNGLAEEGLAAKAA